MQGCLRRDVRGQKQSPAAGGQQRRRTAGRTPGNVCYVEGKGLGSFHTI